MCRESASGIDAALRQRELHAAEVYEIIEISIGFLWTNVTAIIAALMLLKPKNCFDSFLFWHSCKGESGMQSVEQQLLPVVAWANGRKRCADVLHIASRHCRGGVFGVVQTQFYESAFNVGCHIVLLGNFFFSPGPRVVDGFGGGERHGVEFFVVCRELCECGA